MSCILCERQSSTFYDFEVTATMHSITPVKVYCEKLIGTTFVLEDDEEKLICDCCYISLNELDQMEVRIKQIRDDFKSRYMKKQQVDYKDLENETNGYESLDFTTDSPEPLEQKDVKQMTENKIHFTNENDLKSILNVKLNIKEEPSDNNEFKIEQEVEHDVSILYDMMDEKNIEVIVEPKKNDISKKSFQCSKCSLTFKTNGELKAHSVSHNEGRPFICEVCGKVYRHKSALDIHVGMHNGINPFKCVYCNKSFTQKGALIRHVKIHTGEKPFQCEQCGKCFTHHTSFNIHKISHSGEKSYKCELCGLGLISTSHLKRHMRVHTGEKKYSCFTCGKRFAERYNLVSHEKLHNIGGKSSSKKKHKCEICGNAFRERNDLEYHLMRSHSQSDMFISLNE
ncbi:hypothetical protein WA026_003559 [Henosepilachna vigintioctopunctata]|uniref:C2H2-type domain-containing protein n=1 Tax=Henosepilachna vigintioctopunctata TaxID=420089 RepID=A0AAW1TJ82_9CUCU